MNLDDFIREIPDFPKPGILFKDITPLLLDAEIFAETLQGLMQALKGKKVDKIAGIEARGFCFAAPLAIEMGVGFIPLRKPGKLPWEVHREVYQLEYGNDGLEMHQDAIQPGEKVAVVDDLLATGGTAGAAARLIEKAGGKVSALVFVVELAGLAGRANQLKGYDVKSLVQYE